MKCVCVSVVSDTSASCDLLAISPRRARRRRRRRQKSREEEEEEKDFSFFGWRSIIHSHPSTPHVVNVIGRGHVRRPAVDMAILEVRGQRQGQSFVFTGHSESL